MRVFASVGLALSLLSAAGCCQSQPTAAVNPFFRSTVPPPGTVVQPPGAMVPAPVAPSTATPVPGSPYAPSSGFQFQGSSLEQRRRWDDTAVSNDLVVDLDQPVNQAAAAEAPSDITGDDQAASAAPEESARVAARTLDEPEPRRQPEVAESTPSRPATIVRVLSPTKKTLAVEEPTPAEPEVSETDRGVEQASFETSEPIAEVTEPVVAAAEPPGRFSHADDYSLLEGRLEFSQKHRLWKLRYIPLDGVTDAYGGSVNLGEAPDLNDYHEGDFVIVRGEVKAPAATARSFAPTFAIASVTRQ